MIAPREVEDDKVIQPLKPVIRRATPQDDQTVIDNREKEKHAYKVCMEKIAKHELQMKLVQAEYTFDNNKLLFYVLSFTWGLPMTSDRCQRGDEDAGRNRNLWTGVMLLHVFIGFCAGFHQDGKGAESFPESDKNLRSLRQTDVLSEK